MLHPFRIALIFGVLALVVAGCRGASEAAPSPVGSLAPGPTRTPAATTVATPAGSQAADAVTVVLVDYAFEPDHLSVPAGEVTFTLRNEGAEVHEFELFRADRLVDEVEDILPGLEQDLTVTLEAGDYTYVCKLADHEARGMVGTLTVSG